MKEWEVRLISFLLMIYLTSLFCYWTWEAKAPIKISEFPVSSVSFCTLRGEVSFKTSICCVLAFFFLSQLLWEDTKSVSSICDFSHIQNTHVELHTNRTGGRFEMNGPPRRRRSGRITFVSFRSFLALIFTNARLWFLPRPGPSWDTPGLSERSSWRCIWKLAGEIVTE